MKERWGHQADTKLQLIAERVSTRDRFSTLHIATNPVKLLETNFIIQDYESMIKNPPMVGVVFD